MWADLFKRKNKPDLDSRRFQETLKHFDEAQGYAEYHEKCQRVFAKDFPRKASNLQNQGVEHLKILEPTESGLFLKETLTNVKEVISKPEIDYSDMLIVEDESFLQKWFQKVFRPTLHEKLVGYFQSEYLIYWFTFLKAKPSEKPLRSFLWHCDKGPSCHLKILLYLNDIEEHHGNTMFLDRSVTTQFGTAGYVFGSVKKRAEDLSALAQAHHISYQPHMWNMKAGEGIIFEPSQVLHKGILPSTGPRYVLTFCLLPSLIPWQEAFVKSQCQGFGQGYNWNITPQELIQLTKPSIQ